MRVFFILCLLALSACASASLATWERQSLLQEAAEVYHPCGASHCPGSSAIPRGYECNCERLDEHPLCGCEKVNRNDAHPGYIITSEHPLPSNKGAKIGDIVLDPDSDLAKDFSAPKSTPAPLPPPEANECIPNVAEVTPGTCIVGNNPNIEKAAASPPESPATEKAPAANTQAVAKDAKAAVEKAVEKAAENTASSSPSVAAADKVATAAVAATAKESLREIQKATETLKSNQAEEEKQAKKLKETENKVKAEAERVRGQKIEETAIEQRVVKEKQELIIQREALEGVEKRLKELNEKVRKTLEEAKSAKLSGQAAQDVAALSKGMGEAAAAHSKKEH